MYKKKETVYCAHSHFTKSLSPVIAQYVILKGYIPIDPFLALPSDALDALEYDGKSRLALDFNLMRVCDMMFIFGQYDYDKFTYGVQKEYDWWTKHRKIVPIHVTFEYMFKCIGRDREQRIGILPNR